MGAYAPFEGNWQATANGVTAMLTILASTAVALRVYARRLRKAALGWDDYTIFAALFFTWGFAIMSWVGASGGRGYAKGSNLDPVTTLPLLDRALRTMLQTSYAALIIGTPSIGFTKVSVVLLYRRIFRANGNSLWFSISTWFLIVFSSLWMVSFFFALMFQCVPISANWVEYGGTVDQCVQEDILYEAQGWTDSISDLLILLVPIPCVWSLHMPLRQKVAVSSMFLLGSITLAVSVVKLVYWYEAFAALEAYETDLAKVISPAIFWVMVESSIAIVGACLPLLKPIFDDCIPVVRLTSYLRDLTSPSSRGSSRRGLFTTDEEKGSRSSASANAGVSKTSVISHESVAVDGQKSLSQKASFN